MSPRQPKDLLGRPLRQSKSGWQRQIERFDQATMPGRVERLKYLGSIHPGGTFMTSSEVFYLLDEMKGAFINGEFAATLLLCTASIEHWLTGILHDKGFPKEAQSGLKGIVACMRKNKIGQEFVLTKIDRLRLIRNPFCHSKSHEYEHSITRRALNQQIPPGALLEKDAKDAVSLVYTVATMRY